LSNLKLQDYSFIEHLHELTDVRLSNCELTTLPTEILSLPRLSILDLAGNKLTSIPSSLRKMRALQDLRLQNNQIDTILSQQENTLPTSLVKLNLSNNQVQVLPKKMLELTRLNTIDLSDNPIEQIDDAWFRDRAKRTVSLNGCSNVDPLQTINRSQSGTSFSFGEAFDLCRGGDGDIPF